jgi:hypothetical protein
VVPGDQVHLSGDKSVVAASNVAIGIIGQKIVGGERVLPQINAGTHETGKYAGELTQQNGTKNF